MRILHRTARGTGAAQRFGRAIVEDAAARGYAVAIQAQINAILLQSGPELKEWGQTSRFPFDTPFVSGQMIALDGGQHLARETPDVAEIAE